MADQHLTVPYRQRIGLRPMREDDLGLVDQWLREPHVARWWLTSSPHMAEFDAICARVRGDIDTATHMLVVTERAPIGFAQWYRWVDYPSEAAAIGARAGEVGIDYAIGKPAAIGRRLGTEMIAALVRHLRRLDPEAGVLVGPEADNRASRAALERNGFHLVAVRLLPIEESDAPIAIYRLDPPSIHLATTADSPVIGRLLDQFNREYDEPTPGPERLATRIGELIDLGDTAVLLGGEEPEGLAVLRFRPAVWSSGAECNLAELYVTPSHRGLGLGRALMTAALGLARGRGADTMDICVDEPDLPARSLYESLGFTNRSGGPNGALMYFYERGLSDE